ncbi:MAG: ParB/RepB/Spo0J family partition protein [Phycisphaerales bacterium]|nr:ParB/RepB/Spo0J family partition protein [Phycisphaerales bacterium]
MANQKPRKLGRGLSSLLEDSAPTPVAVESTRLSDNTEQIHNIKLDDIRSNTFQPRVRFHDRDLAELAASIREVGVMQPIVVRPAKDGVHELIAGERRWRAARLAGLETIPAVVRDADDRQSAELALIENVQRSDLNPIERANAFRTLMGTFSLTQADVADRVGLDRSSVANFLRLLELPEDVRTMIADGVLSAGHGKMLASIADPEHQRALVERIVSEHLSVRQTEKAVRDLAKKQSEPSGGSSSPTSSDQDANLRDLESKLGEHLQTRVRIDVAATGDKGKLIIEFFGLEQFDGLMSRLGFESS